MLWTTVASDIVAKVDTNQRTVTTTPLQADKILTIRPQNGQSMLCLIVGKKLELRDQVSQNLIHSYCFSKNLGCMVPCSDSHLAVADRFGDIFSVSYLPAISTNSKLSTSKGSPNEATTKEAPPKEAPPKETAIVGYSDTGTFLNSNLGTPLFLVHLSVAGKQYLLLGDQCRLKVYDWTEMHRLTAVWILPGRSPVSATPINQSSTLVIFQRVDKNSLVTWFEGHVVMHGSPNELQSEQLKSRMIYSSEKDHQTVLEVIPLKMSGDSYCIVERTLVSLRFILYSTQTNKIIKEAILDSPENKQNQSVSILRVSDSEVLCCASSNSQAQVQNLTEIKTLMTNQFWTALNGTSSYIQTVNFNSIV